MKKSAEAASAADDAQHMARAIELARRGLYTTHPNPRVGCVIVSDGVVVGEGWHLRAGEPHAEVHALRAAGEKARGATAYVTLEPCCHHGRTPPCSEALIRAGVARVVTAVEDPNPRVAGEGLNALRQAGIRTDVGLMTEPAEALNRGFLSRMRRGRPWVRVKLAMSLDGRTATAAGESRWITGEAAREDVHRLRAEAGAVLTGVGTVLADDPSLNVRLPGDWDTPLRVILDSQLRTPPSSRMFTLPGHTMILTCAEFGPAWQALESHGAEIVKLPAQDGRVDLAAALAHLGRHPVNELLVEAGATLAGSLLASGLADELVLYVAPSLLGDRGKGLVTLPGLETLDRQLRLQITDRRAIGPDWRIMARPVTLSQN